MARGAVAAGAVAASGAVNPEVGAAAGGAVVASVASGGTGIARKSVDKDSQAVRLHLFIGYCRPRRHFFATVPAWTRNG